MTKIRRIAIIGAGLAGLRLAQRLSASFDVCVFEKSRGLGGRMSTRRADGHAFDHGAQYFTAQSDAFRSFLDPYIARGTVVEWAPRLVSLGSSVSDAVSWSAPRYVAVPGMNDLCKEMATNLQIRRGLRIGQVTARDQTWQLLSDSGEDCGVFDWVLSTAPSVQSADLMPDAFTGHPAFRQAAMQGCYSLMLGFEEAIPLPWDAATVADNPLAWIARNETKPGRPALASFLCQSSNDWADAHIEACQDQVRAMLCDAFAQVTGVDVAKASYVSLHKWRFAKVTTPAGQPFLLDTKARLAAAGDWCGAGRVEAAFCSASGLADAILRLETA